MSTAFAFVLVNLTTSATPTNLTPTPAFLGGLCDALEEQTQGPFATAYGERTTTFRVASPPDDRAAGEIAVNFRDTIPEAPGALAYHQVTSGVPDIEIGCDLFASLAQGSEAMSVGVAHEVLETMGDAGANGYKTRADGVTADAEEVCDFVESTFYPASNGMAVSNFVLPSFFVPGSAGPWDFLGVMSSQTDVSKGYGITAQVSGETQIGGTRAAVKPEIEVPAGPLGFMGMAHEARRDKATNAAKAAPAPAAKKPGPRVRAVVGYDMSERMRKRKASRYSRTSRRGVTLDP